jgi:hypothetical protein
MARRFYSSDYREYVPKEREPWHKRKGPPLTLSSAAGGVGLVVGLVIAWLTDFREAPAAAIGGIGGMLSFDFYWRHVRETFPERRR